MHAHVNAATVHGVSGIPVRVEVVVAQGLPMFNIIGLGNSSTREARDRVRAAIASSRFPFPQSKVTVSLTPADLPKRGAGFDLAIALGVLAAAKTLNDDARRELASLGVIGELGLDGSVRSVAGLVSLADGVIGQEVVVAADGANEAAAVRSGEVRGVSSLREVVEWLNGEGLRPSIVEPTKPPELWHDGPDLADVRGQPLARYALEVAAAGGHNLFMQGPPGAGKTMLASRLASILPALDDDEAIALTRVHSVVGLRVPQGGLVRKPPFRAPHVNVSEVALIGGGSAYVNPGEVSRSHGGVLFLDEVGEMSRRVIDQLRTPMEAGSVLISRSEFSVTMPARFQLVAAMNPCPCGLGGGRDGLCRCTQLAIDRYQGKLSSPFLDRFDLRIAVEPPDPLLLFDGGPEEESSAVVRERVIKARARSAERGLRCNADLPDGWLERVAPLSSGARSMLRQVLKNGQLTARGLRRVRTVARTIADLDDAGDEIGEEPIARALGMRVNSGLRSLAA